jgi:succinylglutamate desuccinylase
VLLPLYQGLGDDGFFLCRDVSPFWLRLAAVLQRVQLDRLVHWLPGVERSTQDRHAVMVDPRVARWFTVEVFHLLGYRHRRTDGERLVFTRRWTAESVKEL